MLRWNPPLIKYKRPIDVADAEEARALKRFHEARTHNREMTELMASAARVADSVKRLSEELRHLR
ncbi:MAG: hypothetical protein JOZ75_04915 [Candidatus Dormibacteraeota bacterium]|nr:hypothetical protein [Candidatus Dormibacteraeota bacterium]